MAFQPAFGIDLRETGHECHIVDFAGVGGDSQSRSIVVGAEMFPNIGTDTLQSEPSVRHPNMFPQAWLVDPSHEASNLETVDVDNAEPLAFRNLECVALGGRHNVSLQWQEDRPWLWNKSV